MFRTMFYALLLLGVGFAIRLLCALSVTKPGFNFASPLAAGLLALPTLFWLIALIWACYGYNGPGQILLIVVTAMGVLRS